MKILMFSTHYLNIISIHLKKVNILYHECEGRIEKSVPRFAVWHHAACGMMTNCDHEGQILYPDLRVGISLSVLHIYPKHLRLHLQLMNDCVMVSLTPNDIFMPPKELWEA